MNNTNTIKFELNKDEAQFLIALIGQIAPEKVFIDGWAREKSNLLYDIYNNLVKNTYGENQYAIDQPIHNNLLEKIQEYNFQIQYSPKAKKIKNYKRIMKDDGL